MKYGMNLLLWTTNVDESHYGTLDSLKQIGYDGVELPIFDMDVANFAKLGKKLTDSGLQRTAVTICTDTENPISPDAAIRQAGLDRLKKAIDCCHAVGATHLCGPIHSAIGSFSGQCPTTDEWNWGKETLTKAADYAKQANVTLVVEYLNRFEMYFVNTSTDLRALVEEVNQPNIRMMFDTFHANIEEKDTFKSMKACGKYLAHVHISESDRGVPGTAQVDWEGAFKGIGNIFLFDNCGSARVVK